MTITPNGELAAAQQRAAQWQQVAESAGTVASLAIQLIRVCVRYGLKPPPIAPKNFSAAMDKYMTAVDLPFDGDAEKGEEYLRRIDEAAQGANFQHDELVLAEIAKLSTEGQ